MKKLIFVMALGLTLGSASAFACEYGQDNRTAYVSPGRNGLDWRIDRLNRMLSHVRWELSRYRGDWRLRREVDRISGDVNRVNWRYRHGFDNWRLAHERIRLAFGPDFCGRAVTGEDSDIVPEWKKFLADSAKQKINISSGQIPSSDAAGKEDVATDEQIILA